MRKNASTQSITDRVEAIRTMVRPMTPEEVKAEVEYIQWSINVHGIDAFANPQFINRVQWAMTMGHTITMPSTERMVEIARI